MTGWYKEALKMAGIGNNATGGLLGGAMAAHAQQAQNDHINQLWQSGAQRQSFDPAGYLISSGGQSDAQRMWSGLQELRAKQSTPPAPAPPPSVETVEHKPRVIELESEDE